jgi:hypothetical protein
MAKSKHERTLYLILDYTVYQHNDFDDAAAYDDATYLT